MTQPDQPGPETWLRDRLAAGKPGETWKAVPEIDGCAFSGYEAADTGRARSVDRLGRNGRPLQAKELDGRTGGDGYIRLDMRCDNPACKRPHTFTMQKVVLNTFDGARRRGMQGSHLQGNPAWNWVPEAVAWVYAQCAEVWNLDNEFAAKWASRAFGEEHRDLKVVLCALMLALMILVPKPSICGGCAGGPPLSRQSSFKTPDSIRHAMYPWWSWRRYFTPLSRFGRAA